MESLLVLLRVNPNMQIVYLKFGFKVVHLHSLKIPFKWELSKIIIIIVLIIIEEKEKEGKVS